MSTSVFRQLLLGLALLPAVPAVADIRVEVSIKGVAAEPLQNVRASLSLAQREGQ